MPLFQVESQDDGVFVIKSSSTEEDVCSIVFDSDMGGALGPSVQDMIIKKLSAVIKRACLDHWNRGE